MKAKGFTFGKKWLSFCFPSIPSTIWPVLHSDEFPPPVFNGFVSSKDEETESKKEHIEMEYERTDTESEDSSTESKKRSSSSVYLETEWRSVIWIYPNKQLRSSILGWIKHVLHSSAKVSSLEKEMSSFYLILKKKTNFVCCDNVPPGLLGEPGMPSCNPE